MYHKFGLGAKCKEGTTAGLFTFYKKQPKLAFGVQL
jgi:hypothetical protein